MRLCTEAEDGLEPLWLWLAESGMPMAYESWEKVFNAANARVAAVLASTGGKERAKLANIAISDEPVHAALNVTGTVRGVPKRMRRCLQRHALRRTSLTCKGSKTILVTRKADAHPRTPRADGNVGG